MKLSDIDKNLAEAQPAGILSRAATKLKKHTPFNKRMRDQAAGEEVTQKAANDLAAEFNNWVGRVKASGINPKAIPVDALMKFFTQQGFAKTAQEVIQAAAAEKQPKKDADPAEDKPKTTQGADFTDQANAHLDKNKKKSTSQQVPGYGQVNINAESLEARLAAMLTEDEEEPQVTFNPKEVNQLIMKIVASVHDENPSGLAQRVADNEAGTTSSSSSSSSSGGRAISDEEFEQVRSRIDDFVDEIERTIKKEEIDDAAKKKLLKKIDQLKFDAFNDLQ